MKKLLNASAATAAMLLSVMTYNAQAGTLEQVKAKKVLRCGVNTGLPGFSSIDKKGTWSGMDVDTCKAVAAAVLGDAQRVKFVPLTAKERFTALQSGEIDILSRNTTWTLTRDAGLGLKFAGVNYYDGQGFMVRKDTGIKSALELDTATVCVQAGTTTELNLADYFRTHKMSYKAVTFDTTDQTMSAFDNGRCDVLTSDQSQLYALRIMLKKPDSAVILPEVISKEPLGPVVRQGDDEWFNVVRWSLNAMITAEELGITKTNVKKMRKSKNPNIQRLLGTTGNLGSKLKLEGDWAYNIIYQVGNYGESFEHNIGAQSPLKVKRGINALWNQGGFMYAAPIR